MNTNSAEFLLMKARTQLIISQPFFGTLALKLQLRKAGPGDLPFPTMATDGVHLIYDEQFVLSHANKLDQLIGLVCHEVMHCCMGHPWRMMHVEPGNRRFIAMDIAINPLIRDACAQQSGPQVMRMPDGAMFPTMFKLQEGLSAEEYYRLLPKDPPQPSMCACAGVQNMPGSGKGDDGKGDGKGKGKNEQGSKPSPSDIAVMESEWQIATMQAAQAAKAAGKLPAGLERFVDELRKPVVNWRDVLRRFINQQSADDYRMFPPNRRYVWQGLYLPSLRSESMGEVVVAVDTSGSIGQHELTEFLAELNGICEDTRPRKVHVVSCDAAVQSHDEFTPDQYPLKFESGNTGYGGGTKQVTRRTGDGGIARLGGGGGTDFRPVFDYVEQEDIQPVCLVYLTDMYGVGWPNETDYPVLWAATSDVVAPWGETVRLKVEQEQD